MTTFVDTLFVIALINQRDQYHHLAVEYADLYDGQPLLITDAVLLEIGNALARGYKAEATQVIANFLRSEDVEVVHLTPELFEKAFALYTQFQDKEWGIVDCVSFIVMRERGVTDVLTFDHHFTQAGFRALLRDNDATGRRS